MAEHKCEKGKEIDELWRKYNALHDRFFVDNGKPCIQTTLDRHQRLINVVMWLMTVIGSSVIGMVVRTIFIAIQN